jgi:Rieske Fe-S protein
MSEPNLHADCETQDCFLPTSRRRFLRDSFLTVAGALVAVGMTNEKALAMPLRVTEALHTSGSTKSYALPATDGAQIDKDSEVILVRWQNAVYAFALSCPHQNTALRWEDDHKQFQCPKHHSKYRPDGTFIEGRATRGMDRYAITKSGSGIAVDLDKVFQQDTDSQEWSAAVIHV